MTERAGVDTNTVISALLAPFGKAGIAFDHLLKRYALIASPETVDEIRYVILRKKFSRIPLEIRARFLDEYLEIVTIIVPTEEIRICRDPKDDKFLSLAVAGNAEVILTGDEDLCTLSPFRDIRILKPAQYLESLDDPSLR